MTSKGTLMSIDRFGINRGNIGPHAKCSFEETTDQLFKPTPAAEAEAARRQGCKRGQPEPEHRVGHRHSKGRI